MAAIQDASASWVIHVALYSVPKLKVALVDAGSRWLALLLDLMADVYKKTPESFPAR